jgi:filamentous hemagglutinin
LSGQIGFYTFSAGGAVNLHNGNLYGQWGVGRAYPAFSLTPGVSVSTGRIFGARGAADTDAFLSGAGIQGNVFVPVPILPLVGAGGGLNHSYGGRTAAEIGISVPPGAAVTPLSYGFSFDK